jgi:hypothetical protein
MRLNNNGMGGIEDSSRRTLAKSFASWPPWLMTGYLRRVAAEGSMHVPAVAQPRYRSPLPALLACSLPRLGMSEGCDWRTTSLLILYRDAHIEVVEAFA